MTEKPDYKKLLENLLCRVNHVTASHRHGNKISKGSLDLLCNKQIEIEKELDLLQKDNIKPEVDYEYEFSRLLDIVDQFIKSPQSKTALQVLKNSSNYYHKEGYDG